MWNVGNNTYFKFDPNNFVHVFPLFQKMTLELLLALVNLRNVLIGKIYLINYLFKVACNINSDSNN